MASPQKENGYTAIANEILEKLVQTPILVSELKLVLFVIRKTYGYNKKEDIVSISQFVSGIKISRASVIRGLKSLVSAHILVKAPILDKQGNTWKLNKNWEEWLLVSTHRPVSQNNLTSIKHDAKPVSTHRHTKDNTKDNTKNIIANKSRLDELFENRVPTFDELSQYLISDPKPHIQIIGEYIAWKRPILKTKEQFSLFMGQNVKHAVNLAKWSAQEIKDTWGYMDLQKTLHWKLATTLKYITQEI